MPKLHKVLSSLLILGIIVTAFIFSLGIILIGTIVVSLFGIYRYYLVKKRSRVDNMRPYSSGEVIDLKPK